MGNQEQGAAPARPRLVPAEMIPKRNEVTVDQVVELLNAALALDDVAITNLLQTRVACNKKLAEHQTIQVGLQPHSEKEYEVGILGLINGMFGIDEESWGAIAAELDPAGHVHRFLVREPWTGVFTERVDS